MVQGAVSVKAKTTLLLATALVVPDGAHGAASDAVCEARGSRTVIKTDHATIYRRAGTTFGCLFSVGRRFKIGEYSPADERELGIESQRRVRLAGRFVAFEDFVEAPRTLKYAVRVFDLRTGRKVRDAPTGPTPPEADRETQFGVAVGIGPTTGLRLRATGGVAWIARNRYVPEPQFQVRKNDRTGHTELAAGADIQPSSLTLSGSLLGWVEAGQEQKVRLRCALPRRRATSSRIKYSEAVPTGATRLLQRRPGKDENYPGQAVISTPARLIALGVLAASVVPAGSAAGTRQTRLIHGPLVLRLTGQAEAEREDPTTDWSIIRYAVVFKLNRDPLGRYKPVPDASAVMTRGRFSVEGYGLDETLDRFYDPEKPRRARYCFIGYVEDDSDDPESTFTEVLDRVPLGRRVKTRLQPLTPREGDQVLGRVYTIRATVRTADVRLASAAARRTLRRIGCA